MCIVRFPKFLTNRQWKVSDPNLRERPNIRRQGDADLSMILMGSQIYTGTCPVLFDILLYVPLRVAVGVRLARMRGSSAVRGQENYPVTIGTELS